MRLNFPDSGLLSRIDFFNSHSCSFKSVFKITDQAEVHSRGFHVRFDITPTNGLNPYKLGYLVPAWIPRTERVIAVQDGVRAGFTTVIRLPFKSQVIDSVEDYRKELTQIKPQLLLFLRKLDNVSIFDHLQGMRRDMKRQFNEDGRIATLSTTTSRIQSYADYADESGGDPVDDVHQETERWLVARKYLKCSAGIRRSEEAGQAQQLETEIAIALPLRASGAAASGEMIPRNQPVFAYLPVAEYGLRFIVQADFVVSSSRETLQENHVWNQWLANELPDLLCDAFEHYKECLLPRKLEPDDFRRSQDQEHVPRATRTKVEGYSGLSEQDDSLREVVRFYHLLPTPRDTRGLFCSVAQTMLDDIRGHEIMLTSDGSWRLPAHTVVVPVPCEVLCRTLISDRLLHISKKLSFVHHGLLQEVPDRNILHKQLGVLKFGVKMLLDVLEWQFEQQKDNDDIYGATGCPISKAKFAWLALVLIERLLNHRNAMTASERSKEDPAKYLERLRKIPMIPLIDGSFGAVDVGHGPIFKPSGKEWVDEYAFSSELRFIKMPPKGEVDPKDFIALNRILPKLGVRDCTHQVVLEKYIIPVIDSVSARKELIEKPKKLVSSIVVFVQNLWFSMNVQQRAKLINRLNQKLVVATSSGNLVVGEQPIHFSGEFGSNVVPPSVLGIDWTFLDVSQKCWRDPRLFFEQLGIRDFAIVDPIRKYGLSFNDLSDAEQELLRQMAHSVENARVESLKFDISDWDFVGDEFVNAIAVLGRDARVPVALDVANSDVARLKPQPGENCLHWLNRQKKCYNRGWQPVVDKYFVQGSVEVFTPYNGRRYTVAYIAWDKTPTHPIGSNMSMPMTHTDFYRNRYGKVVTDDNQALIAVEAGNKTIHLLPEFTSFRTAFTVSQPAHEWMGRVFKIIHDKWDHYKLHRHIEGRGKGQTIQVPPVPSSFVRKLKTENWIPVEPAHSDDPPSLARPHELYWNGISDPAGKSGVPIRTFLPPSDRLETV